MALLHTQVNLAQLDKPQVVEELAFETIYQAMRDDLVARDPSFTALLESDPAIAILQVAAYREMLLRQRVNEACYGTMLAYATGTDLDHIGARYDVARLVIRPANHAAIPPTPAELESDDDFRARIQLSTEGYTTAGSLGAYTFHAMNADGDVKDVKVNSLTPGTVNVAILSRTGDGTASPELISSVAGALTDEVVRPLCDTVAVEGGQIVPYTIVATLIIYPGVGATEVVEQAQKAVAAYTAARHKLDHNITISGLHAALHQPGVQNAIITAPAGDIDVAWNQAAYCTAINITLGGTNE